MRLLYMKCYEISSRDSNPGPDSSLGSRSIQLSYLVVTKIQQIYHTAKNAMGLLAQGCNSPCLPHSLVVFQMIGGTLS